MILVRNLGIGGGPACLETNTILGHLWSSDEYAFFMDDVVIIFVAVLFMKREWTAILHTILQSSEKISSQYILYYSRYPDSLLPKEQKQPTNQQVQSKCK